VSVLNISLYGQRFADAYARIQIFMDDDFATDFENLKGGTIGINKDNNLIAASVNGFFQIRMAH
jgi:hypothetical protein